MDTAKITKRLEEIQGEHSQILDQLKQLTEQRNQAEARRLYLEGAFYELEKLLNDLNGEPEKSEENVSDIPTE